LLECTLCGERNFDERAIIQRVMSAELNVPQVGMKAPEFFIDTADGRRSLHQLAARHGNLVLTSQDSYRYHPN
jgi:hypothetical protein